MRTAPTSCPGFGNRRMAKQIPSRRKPAMRGASILNRAYDLEGNQRPDIVNRAFSVTVELGAPGSNGVLAAQGGSVNGFSLYFKGGDLHGAIRRDSDVQVITANAVELANARKLTASLSHDGTPRLSIDGREVATGKAEGLIPK